MIAWFAVVFGINSTHNAVNCTRLCLVQLLSAFLVLLIPNTIANHAITYTNAIACRSTFSSFKCLLGGTTPKRPKVRQTFDRPFSVINMRNGDSLLGHLTQSSQDLHFERPLCGHGSNYYVMANFAHIPAVG